MTRPKGSKNKTKLVDTLVKIEGAPLHAFEAAEDNGELPILTAVGMARISPDSNDFVSYTLQTKGKEVLSMEVSEPNLRAIVQDEAKINFVQEFLQGDG